MEGRLSAFSLNRDGTQNITVTVEADFGPTYDELKDQRVTVEIKKASKHRSLEANRYAWVLIDQIAAKTHIKQSEVYRNAIRDIGGVSGTGYMKVDAVPVFREIWEKGHLGNQVEILDVEDSGWASIRVYYGSSTYDAKQMHALLESLIQDAEALGIPTITPKEEQRLVDRWARKKEKQ